MNDLSNGFMMFLFFLSPILFLTGLGILIFSKDMKKKGLWLILLAVILFVIGFGVCLSNLHI